MKDPQRGTQTAIQSKGLSQVLIPLQVQSGTLI